MENLRWEGAPNVVRETLHYETLKASLKDFYMPLEWWEQITHDHPALPHQKWIGRLRVQASVKLNVSAKSTAMDNYQSRHFQNWLALFAPDSLGLILVWTVIKEHANALDTLKGLRLSRSHFICREMNDRWKRQISGTVTGEFHTLSNTSNGTGTHSHRTASSKPCHEKTCLTCMPYANDKGADQPVHP